MLNKETVIKAIRLDKRIEALSESLETFKVELREQANGETVTYPVPGYGILQITKPGGGVTTTSEVIKFNAEQYKLLDPKTKKLLEKKGVVTESTVTSTSKVTAPAVKITHNV